MQIFNRYFFFVAFFGWSEAQRACNNSPLLCSQPYDTVTYLGAHDSPFLRDAASGFSSFGNQLLRTTTQLDAGVRLLSAQVHLASNNVTGKRELHLCHTTCALFDAGPLRDWLIEVRMWMDTNTNDIITLLLVNTAGVDARELEGVYSEADIARLGYVPPRIDQPPPLSNKTNPTWPTLNEMIDRNERLVSLVDPLMPDPANAPYLLDQHTFTWENTYAVTDPANFTCSPDRPANQTMYGMLQSGRMFLMNHFLYWQQAFGIQTPDIRVVNDTNSWNSSGALGVHMVDCANQVTRQPAYVLVDFFNVGRAIASVDVFNKVSNPVGRMSVSDQAPGEDTDIAMSAACRYSKVSLFVAATAFLVAAIMSGRL
ncbi:hypothetical protein EJ04DRAFT_600308 [Polyplosphaeria fusca]|uniref:PLC-like phosphodiesterase n=1 Tax=Polyplosphaeria fusca TaxID=682080 RepID=A0A9P4RAI1_9PLEO|nr:hypothetical protein EJ04DRAFT_600308 [Polyplosphaeria fusca]